MKTKMKVFSRMIQISVSMVLTLLTLSCETEIPLDDRTPPSFSFRITGDGFDHTFDQDFDYDNFRLVLKEGVTYEFSFVGADSGGLDQLQWRTIDRSVVLFLGPTPTSPWAYARNPTIRNGNGVLIWRGDRNNPLTGSAFAGRFAANIASASTQFIFYARDFGGESGMKNSILEALNIYVGDTTEIVDL